MLHYFKDTLRYVKLFGALKSILKHGGVAVPDSKAGALHQHRLPAAESKPAPEGWEWRGGPRGRGERGAARRRQPAPSLRHAPRDQAVTLHSSWLGAWAPPHPWGITNRGRGDKVTGDTQNLS